MLYPMYLAIEYASDNELVPAKTATTISANYLDVKDRKYKSKVDEKQVRYLTPDQMKALVSIKRAYLTKEPGK